MSPIDRRVATWIDLTGDLLSQADVFQREVLLEQVHETFGCQVSWNWSDPAGSTGFLLHTPIPGWPTPDAVRRMVDNVSHHPVLRYYLGAGESAAMSIGRVPSCFVTPQGRGVIREVLRPVGMEQQMSVPYRMGPGEYRAFILSRSGDDFSEDDVLVARQIQPLLGLLDRQARTLLQTLDAVTSNEGLSGREISVLCLLADGLTAYSISRRLGISERTVHRHLGNLYRKLGVHDRLRAVAVGREAGLVPDGTPAPVPRQVRRSVTPTSGVVVGGRVPSC
jgi:DNA-binding CsgD family transcriptional regulator